MSYTAKCFGGPLHGRVVTNETDRLHAAVRKEPVIFVNEEEFGVPPWGPTFDTVTYRYEQIQLPISSLRFTFRTVGLWIYPEDGWDAVKVALT